MALSCLFKCRGCGHVVRERAELSRGGAVEDLLVLYRAHRCRCGERLILWERLTEAGDVLEAAAPARLAWFESLEYRNGLFERMAHPDESVRDQAARELSRVMKGLYGE